MHVYTYACADLEGGRGGPDPPWNLQKNTADITGNEKKVNFHICALPQLYVKFGPPPGKIFGIRACICNTEICNQYVPC